MRRRFDRLFDELENVGKDSSHSDDQSGWETALSDAYSIAYEEPVMIPVEHKRARRTEGVKAGHRVIVSFRSRNS